MVRLLTKTADAANGGVREGIEARHSRARSLDIGYIQLNQRDRHVVPNLEIVFVIREPADVPGGQIERMAIGGERVGKPDRNVGPRAQQENGG